MEPDDESLLAAWREGDDRAGSKLLRRHFISIAQFFERRVPEPALDDLVQLTFMAAFQARDRMPEGVRFRAYLFGIARKKLLMHLRSNRAKSGRESPLPSELAAASSLGPSRVIAAREEAAVMLEAVQTLPEELQMVVELYYCEELSVREVASVLERPTGTIKTWLHRARGLLREAIAELELPRRLTESTLLIVDSMDTDGR